MKRLSLFDQLQIRFPIRARTNVRRSAEAGAAAATASRSGFGGTLLTYIESCPQVQANEKTILTISPVGKYLSKDILAEVAEIDYTQS
jgi:hypothetical protein